MADIILKDFNAIEQTYEGVEKVKFNTADGGTQVFSAGEAVDDVEISLDFKNGDQRVSAPEGSLVKSAIIRKPEELVPQNIAKGRTIAGIEGDYEGEAIENIEITLDFRNGDQTVNAQGKLIKSATILKPADLLPENIVKDKEIAGIKGIYEVAPTETESLTITENGTYTAPEGKAYSPIIVDVPETEIEPLTITENGTYTAPDGKAYSPIIVNVPSSGVTETDIFPEDTVSGFQEDTDLLVGTYFKYVEPPFEIKEGETYYVEWEDQTYTCKGMAVSFNGINAVYLGNGERLGYPHNNEPFAVVYLVDACLTEFMTFADGSYKVRVYQKSGSDNSGGGDSGGLLPNIELKEILSPRTLTFEVGGSDYIPNTPAVVLADGTAVANMDVLNDGEGGLVVFDGKVYPVYAGERQTSKIQFSWGQTSLSVLGGIGNIGIPSAWMTGTVVEDAKSYGSSKEPFLIIANSSAGFVVAIPEKNENDEANTDLTHTLQIYKLIQTVYVTFMNGETELLKHPVIIDKNCENVIATGVLATPTREMTVDKVFTFSGWSLTEGGAVNSSALTNVTRDRTVYAVFDEAPRKYTVRFYDGDTVLSEQEVEYGKQATPPSTSKDGHRFIGWTPSDLTITGDTDFHGTWEAKKELTNQALPSGITGAYFAKYSADGTRLFFLYGSKLHMYDTTTQPYTLLNSQSISGVNAMDVSSDGKYVALVNSTKSSYLSTLVSIYAVGATTLTKQSVISSSAKFSSSKYAWSGSFSADSSKFIVYHASGYFGVFNVSATSTWTFTSAQLPKTVSLRHLQFNSDATKVVGLMESTSTLQSIYIYDATNNYTEVTGTYLSQKTGKVVSYNGDQIAYSPDGRYLAMCFETNKSYTSTNSYLVVYDTTTTPYTVVKKVTATSTNITATGVAFNGDGTLLALSRQDSPYIEVYNTSTWELMEAPKTLPTVASICCAFSADNHLFVGGSSASTLYKI